MSESDSFQNSFAAWAFQVLRVDLAWTPLESTLPWIDWVYELPLEYFIFILDSNWVDASIFEDLLHLCVNGWRNSSFFFALCLWRCPCHEEEVSVRVCVGARVFADMDEKQLYCSIVRTINVFSLCLGLLAQSPCWSHSQLQTLTQRLKSQRCHEHETNISARRLIYLPCGKNV